MTTRKLLTSLLTLLLCLPLAAQQQVGDVRTHNIFAFPEFQEAKVLQPFGRHTTAKANILLKKSTLCFMQNDTIKEAYVQNVLGVEFTVRKDSAGKDSIVRYMKVDNNRMGRVLAAKGYNYLLCVTTINEKKLKDETVGGDNLPYFEAPDVGFFTEIDGDAFEYDKGYPLSNRYYFNLQGSVIVANETNFKRFVRPEMKTAFKNLMNDRFWSWNDPASLAQLFTFLPEK